MSEKITPIEARQGDRNKTNLRVLYYSLGLCTMAALGGLLVYGAV